ncbi:MAG: hypothetical protein HRT38_13590, partial [Alteromonadaceae bacterium]|nr:hypothetical protein [Alteromonadaceae bacterium]
MYRVNAVLILFLLFVCASINAQSVTNDKDKWLSLLENSNEEQLYISPNGQITIVLHKVKYPLLATLAQPSFSLAGLEFYSSTTSRVDLRRYSHISLLNAPGKPLIIRPESGVIIDYYWAPDSTAIALLIESEQGIHLWLYEIKKQQLRKLSSLNLSARLGGRHLRWLPDGSAILAKTSAVMKKQLNINILQPRIESTELKIKQGRTYKNLLNTTDKRQKFKSLTSARLVKVDLQGNHHIFDSATMIKHYAISPDGNYVLVESLPSKLSAYIPHKKWGSEYQIVSLVTGKGVYQLSNFGDKINLNKAKDTVPNGARGVQWLPFEKSTISWAEAIDDGVMATPQAIHDVVYELQSPFVEKKKALLEVTWRYYDLIWGGSGVGVLQDWRYKNKALSTFLLVRFPASCNPVDPGSIFEI